jgi:eukaryotic-like serine/threonine-protein kinase
MFHAYHSAPHDYAEEVPEELGAICNRATHRDPETRHPDAEALRQDVATFRRQRSAIQMTETLQYSLEALGELAGAEELIEEEAIQAHRLFGECRFGFSEALEVYPQSQRARQGLRQTRLHMIDVELALENPSAAEALLDELDPPDPARAQALQALKRRLDAQRSRVAQLERLEHNVDLSVDRRRRGVLTLLLGGIWTSSSLMMGWLSRQPGVSFDQRHMIAVNLITSVLVLGVLGWAWRNLRLNVINRRLMTFVLLIATTGPITKTLSWLMGLSVENTIVMEVSIYAACTTTMAIFVDLRLLAVGVLFLAAALGGVFFPEYGREWVSACNAVAMLLIAWLWIFSMEAREEPEPESS